MNPCTIEGCVKRVQARGWCPMHYTRWRKHGDPHERGDYNKTPEERIALHTSWVDGCLVWGGRTTEWGYLRFSVGGRLIYGHRYVWERVNGPIPEGMQIDHMCHNPACLNVEHLRVVTNQQNQQHHSGPYRNSTSGFRGVFWDKAQQKWTAKVRLNGKLWYGGHYSDLAEANAAAVALRNKLHTHNDNDRK